MSKDMNCNIIRDLIPSYLDDICSAESKAMVEEHVKSCTECKATLESMARDFDVDLKDMIMGETAGDSENDTKESAVEKQPVQQEKKEDQSHITIDEKEVMKRVNEKLQRDMKKRVAKYVIGAIVVVLAVITLLLPIQTMNYKDMDIRYTTFSVKDNMSEDGVYFSQLGEQDTVYTSEDADLDNDKLYPIETYWDQGCIYADMKWIELHPYYTIVSVWSEKPISKYKYSVREEDGENVFCIDRATTYALAPKNKDGYVMQIVVETNVDRVK